MTEETRTQGEEAVCDSVCLIDAVTKGDSEMPTIEELIKEVETYKQAIQDAKDALASAEQELEETLAYEYENQ